MDDLARLRRAFEAPDPPAPGERPRFSAVLLPIVPLADGPALLFTRRASHLNSHPGEISFPGGRVEDDDDGPRGAALREFEEEVGLDAARVDVLGHLTDYLTFRNVLVRAFVGVLPGGARPARPHSEDEVEEVLLVPLARLAAPAAGRADGAAAWPVYGCDAYEGREWPDGRHRERLVHYWRLVPPPARPRTVVWGITGELLARFLGRAQGWAPPAPPRRIASPAEYLP